jgi:transposase-like protein
VIILSVRWHLRFALSYRDVEEPASLGVAAAFDELALAI